MPDFILTEYEQALRQIKSVQEARIRVAEQGEIEEIHILASEDRNPKQIVRDVESVLAAKFGLEFDHKKISVAQVKNGKMQAESPESARPKLVGVSFRTVNGNAEVLVELEFGDKIISGSAQGVFTSNNKLRLIVEAVVKAINGLELNKCFFVSEDITATDLAKQKVALAAVTFVCPQGEQLLTGSALVKNDVHEAVVKAVLDAVNRKVGIIPYN